MTNIEAITNIGANLAEIVGIAGSPGLMFLCWVPQVNGKKGYIKEMVLWGLGLLVTGVATPFLVSLAFGFNPYVGAGLSWALCLPVVFFALKGYFFPSIIARRFKHKRATAITIVNCFSFLLGVILWPVILVWACYGKESPTASPTPAQPDSAAAEASSAPDTNDAAPPVDEPPAK